MALGLLAPLQLGRRRGVESIRDVKPSTVLLAEEGPDEHAYLTDFGVTKELARARI